MLPGLLGWVSKRLSCIFFSPQHSYYPTAWILDEFCGCDQHYFSNAHLAKQWSLFVIFFKYFLPLSFLVAIKILKPKLLILEFPVTPIETTPLLNLSSSCLSTVMSCKTIKWEIHSPLFDLNLAWASLLVQIVSYTLIGLVWSLILFVLSVILGSNGHRILSSCIECGFGVICQEGWCQNWKTLWGYYLFWSRSSGVIMLLCCLCVDYVIITVMGLALKS